MTSKLAILNKLFVVLTKKHILLFDFKEILRCSGCSLKNTNFGDTLQLCNIENGCLKILFSIKVIWSYKISQNILDSKFHTKEISKPWISHWPLIIAKYTVNVKLFSIEYKLEFMDRKFCTWNETLIIKLSRLPKC